MEADISLKANYGTNYLHIAALNGDLNLCKMLIDKDKVDLHMTDNKGCTAVHFSAESGNYELVAYFVEMGADIGLKTNDGRNCLHIAALNGDLNLCKMLIDNHNVDLHMTDNKGSTAVHYSSQSGNYELVAYFVEMGADINLKTDDGRNCLHIAALNGDLNLCKMLIDKHKVDLDMTTNQGWTAVHCSAQSGNYELVAYFAGMGADILLKLNDGRNCLHIAALNGDLNLCKMLIDKHKVDLDMTTNQGWTAVHCSAQSGNYELVAYFAGMGADILLKLNDGRNCLHIAALNGDLNLCKMLIDKHKVDLRMTDNKGCTAVHYSSQSGNYELVAYFVEMGAGIHLKTDDGRNCLHIAALNGDLNLCKMLIDKHKVDLDMTTNQGWTAVHCSAQSGNYELVAYFAGMGADILLKLNDGRNCLHIAALNGDLNLCKMLIDKHKVDLRMTDNKGCTAVHYSSQSGNYELVAYFVEMGADIHLKTDDGRTGLHIAARKGHLNLCKMLIDKHKVDLHITDNEGWTAVHCSSQSGNYELVAYFVEMGADIHLKTDDGRNCLHIAALNGDLNLCKMLIDKHKVDLHMTDNKGCTAVHYSAPSGNYELVAYFVEMGAGIPLKTDDGRNCLHIAARKGHFNLCKMLIDKHKVDLHITDNEGWTAVHCSSQSGNYELVAYFVEMGADIHLKTDHGRNCLHIAALKGHLNLCKMLIDKHKVDLHITDNEGATAVHCSAESGNYELVAYFAGMGADIRLKTNYGTNCLHIAALKGDLNICKMLINKHKVDLDMTANHGFTAVHCSAQNGNYELVAYFVGMGADIHLKTDAGRNCLHIAALQGHLNLCKMLIDKYKVDLHMTDNEGCTAVHCSAQSGNYELVAYFVEMGADIHLKTDDGRNCLHIAALEGHLNLCKMLIDKHKVDLDMTINQGWTAVHCSAQSGNYELVAYFAGMGADILLKLNDGRNCLHIAALNGDLNLCKMLINKHKVDLDMTTNQGWTVVHCSAQSGNYELVGYFAGMGADIHPKIDDGRNCLHIAAINGHLNLCKMLIDKYKVDLHMTDNKGCTAVHLSAQSGNYKLVAYFVEMGAGIHLKTDDGRNCLHIAALNGDLNLCKMLIDKHKVDLHMTDNKGCTAVHYSSQSGNYELVAYFVEMGADIHLKTDDGRTGLHIAARKGHLKLCKMLIDKHKVDLHITDNKGWTAVHCSSQSGNYELVAYFVEMGADIHLKTDDGRNCLHIAALQGHLNLCKMLIDKHKFDLHMTDNEGCTAVLYSAPSGNYELVAYFVEMGADIHLKTDDGRTCLHIAARKGHFNLCKMLIDKHKVDLRMTDNKGCTAVHYSSQSGNYELVAYFVEMGAGIHLKTDDGRNCLHIAALNGDLNLCKMLIDKHKVDLRMTDNKGCTAVHYSSQSGNYELVAYFVEMGADIHLKTDDGRTGLHIAARKGHFNLCKMLIDKHKVDLHITDNEGWTAVHCSSQSGNYELVAYFVEMGADIHLKTDDGRNCLHIAAREGHLRLCKYFLEIHNFDVNMTDNRGMTSLHNSAINGSFDLFLYILRMEGEIYCKTNNMENVLHFSSKEGHVDISKFVLEHFTKDFKEKNSRSQHILISKSYVSQVFYKYNIIFLHAMDNDGNTYLHLAAVGNQAKVCELLLKYDTDVITLLNKKDETARNIAQERCHKDVLTVLKAEYDRTGMFFRGFLY